MARVVVLTASFARAGRGVDWLRRAVVSGCALALILASAPLPF